MKSIEPLYYGESIGRIHYRRIARQLQTGNLNMKKDIHAIIIRPDGRNLFEFLGMEDYARCMEVNDDFLLVGACKDYEEFGIFITDFVQSCIDDGVPIQKSEMLEYLQIWQQDRSKDENTE